MDTRAITIQGSCDPAFGKVKDAFARNFTEQDEHGAAVAVYRHGKPIIDLWGGVADPRSGAPWQRDTMAAAFSISKAFTATAGHMAVERGLLDLDAPVARYWPEFGANGKDKILVRQLFTHQAGLYYIDADLKPGDAYDWDLVTRALAAQKPVGPVGETPVYHSMTFGYLIGEVLRRVTGKTIAPLVREWVTGPLDADFHFALTDAQIARCAHLVMGPMPNPPPPPRGQPEIVALTSRGGASGDRINSEAFRKAQMGAGSGHGTARGIARFFAALGNGGELDGTRILKADTVKKATSFQIESDDPVFAIHNRFALGYQLNTPGEQPMGPSMEAFGHMGAGHRIGFSDPKSGLSFGYVGGLFGVTPGLGPRGVALVRALYDSIG